jgi:hypothetical protein
MCHECEMIPLEPEPEQPKAKFDPFNRGPLITCPDCKGELDECKRCNGYGQVYDTTIRLSKEEGEYLSLPPKPLKILIPVTIEEDEK